MSIDRRLAQDSTVAATHGKFHAIFAALMLIGVLLTNDSLDAQLYAPRPTTDPVTGSDVVRSQPRQARTMSSRERISPADPRFWAGASEQPALVQPLISVPRTLKSGYYSVPPDEASGRLLPLFARQPEQSRLVRSAADDFRPATARDWPTGHSGSTPASAGSSGGTIPVSAVVDSREGAVSGRGTSFSSSRSELQSQAPAEFPPRPSPTPAGNSGPLTFDSAVFRSSPPPTSAATGSATAPAAPPPTAERPFDPFQSKVSPSPPVSEETMSAGLAAGDVQLTVEQVDARRTAAQATDLPADAKASIETHYQQAIEFLKLAVAAQQRTDQLRTEIAAGPELTAELKAKIATPPAKPETEPIPTEELKEIETLMRASEEAVLGKVRGLEAWDAAAAGRKKRIPELPSLIEQTGQKLTDARGVIKRLPTDGPSELVEARRSEQLALVQLLDMQLVLYRTEQTHSQALSELFPLQREWLQRRRKYHEKRLEILTAAVADSRRRESERQAADALRTLQQAHPALRELAERNAHLTEQRKKLQDFLARIDRELADVGTTLEGVESDFKNAQEKEKRAGLTTSVGMLLRNQRSHLPSTAVHLRRSRSSEDDIARMQLEQMELEDEREQLANIDNTLDSIVAGMSNDTAESDPDGAHTDQGRIREMAETLIQDRRRYLDDLLGDYDTCLGNLAELDVRGRKLSSTVAEFRSYIDERVLWIRSARVADASTIHRSVSAVSDLFSPRRWVRLVSNLRDDMLRYPYATAFAVFMCVLLLGLRRRFVALLYRTAEIKSETGIPTIAATLAAIGLTVLIASVWPGLLWLVGWRLSSSVTATEFGVAVGNAVLTVAWVYWSLELLRKICRQKGLAECHLNWPVRTLRSLHNRLIGLITYGLPFVLVVVLSEQYNEGVWADSLGRLVFLAGMPLLALTLNGMINPRGAVLRGVLERNKNGWMYRLQSVWHVAIVSAPFILGAMVIAGYQYTARELLVRLELTLWLAMLVLVGYSLGVRWIDVAQKNVMRIQRSKFLRLKLHGSDESDDPALRDSEPATRVEMAAMKSQIDTLARAVACIVFVSGGWMIWSEVLPAIQMLDHVELWTATVQMAETVTIGDGISEMRAVPKVVPVTLVRLLFALAMMGFTLIAARNVPGLLELSILNRLPMDQGGRHAVTTLCRYGITMLGVVLAFRTIHVGWSSVQWLVAALTVGLGFGLQEIFANFISGLILLFERPIRIGDVVTIDNVSGRVARIEIRATTIRDFDEKEYIVPNKEFVTGRLLNWTLSDKTIRLLIPVGVAYGSDTDLARSLMVKAATENSIILAAPVPSASFEGFGDSSLNLVLRCYLPNLDNRLQVLTEVHTAIHRAFAESGIEIPFPKLDLNLKSIPAGFGLTADSASITRKAA